MSLYFGGKSHVSNGQNVSFKEPCQRPSDFHNVGSMRKAENAVFKWPGDQRGAISWISRSPTTGKLILTSREVKTRLAGWLVFVLESEPKNGCVGHLMKMAMGQNPTCTPSEHPNPPTKIGPKTGGAPTNQSGIPLVLTTTAKFPGWLAGCDPLT